MQPRGRGVRTYPLEELTPGEFEALAFLFARAGDPAVVPVRNKDRGLDVRLPDDRQFTRRGWQAKRYAKDEIHWGQCRKSVETAVAFWRPPRITFVFAHELSAKEQVEFRTDLVEEIAHPLVLDYVPEAEIQRWLRGTDEGRQAATWLFEDSEPAQEQMQRAMAMAGPLRDAMHAAERLAEIQAHLDKDPHFDYTTVTDKVGGPVTPSAKGTVLSVFKRQDDVDVRFDAREKFPGALDQLGMEGAIVFSDDEAGRQARQAIDEALRTGKGVSAPAGAGIRLSEVPVGMRGVMTDEPVFGELTLLPVETEAPAPPPPKLVGVLTAAEHELGVAFVIAETPVEGWDGTLAAAAGGLHILHSIRGDDDSLEHNFNWRHVFGEGSALEQLLACRVLRAALAGEEVRLLVPATRDQMWLLKRLEGDYAEDIRDLQLREQFLEFVAELEEWVGQAIVVPARPSDEDVATLSRTLGRVRNPQSTPTWERFEVTLTGEIPDHPIEVLVHQPRYVTLFDQELFLGIEQMHLPLAVSSPTEDGVELTPVSGHEQLAAVLYRPAELAPDAIPKPGQSREGRVQYRDPQAEDESEPAA